MVQLLTEKTQNQIALPKKSNLINYSVLNEFYSTSPFRSFAIKYVVDGTEQYSVNGRTYDVKNKQYLLANYFSEGFARVDSKTSVKGICIDVAPEILSSVVANYLQPNTLHLDLDLDHFFNSASFIENKYSAQNTKLGNLLLQLEVMLANKSINELSLNKEFYYLLAEKIVEDYIPIFKQFQNVKALKPETKKDLLRKVLIGKDYIDCCYTSSCDIEFIAKEAGLSEYHFFRTFKDIFKITPHQYIIQNRLNFAKKLLESDRQAISTIAIACGFSDIYSFSKSFKKFFGYSPSSYHLSN